jgi:hypothetical protein
MAAEPAADASSAAVRAADAAAVPVADAAAVPVAAAKAKKPLSSYDCDPFGPHGGIVGRDTSATLSRGGICVLSEPCARIQGGSARRHRWTTSWKTPARSSA